MADIIAALVAHLNADPGVDALVDGRIYHDHLPEARVLPAITCKTIAGTQRHVARYARPYIRLQCWSYTHLLSSQVAEAVRCCLEKYSGMMGGTVRAYSLVEDISDGRYEPLPAPGIYPVNVYVHVWYAQDVT